MFTVFLVLCAVKFVNLAPMGRDRC